MTSYRRHEYEDARSFVAVPSPSSSSSSSSRRRRFLAGKAPNADDHQQPQAERRRIGRIHVATWKEKTQDFLDGRGGLSLETLNVVLSVVLVVVSVIESYEKNPRRLGIGDSMFELICTGIFILDFLGVLLFMIFTVIFVAAGVIQVLDESHYKENDLPPLQFHQAVYFVFVTISTVGYGDFSPKTTASQFFVIVIICVVVTVIPRQVNRLVELSRLHSGYMHSYSLRKRGASSGGHVIVTGCISYESVSSFLRDRELKELVDHIIICGPLAHSVQIACHLHEVYRNELLMKEEIVKSEGEASAAVHMRPLILLLVKQLPRDDDIQNLSTPLPDRVFIEKGVSQNVEDLLRVRGYMAKAVLMIPGNWKYHVDELRDESAEEVNEHLLDYQVIMSTLSLRTVQELHREHLQHTPSRGAHADVLSRRFTVTCSVVKWHSSVEYFAHKSHLRQREDHDGAGNGLEPWVSRGSMSVMAGSQSLMAQLPRTSLPVDTLWPGHSATFMPSYAAGEVFVDGVLDTLLCQSFFNPYVIDLIRALAGDCYYYYAGGHTSQREQPKTFVASMMRFFQSSRRSEHEDSDSDASGDADTDMRTHSVTDDDEMTTPQPEYTSAPSDAPRSKPVIEFPVLTMATVAQELEGRSFASVFTRALEQDILVLGIYRRANDLHLGNALPYVYTCPPATPNVTVKRGDVLHVVTCRLPPVSIH
ncbi:hypothetical protein P43SY_002908 [Pythium insidiosum]|uniref:Potassium channel domain-containing protein n=1 Tax=Pythium insidiosum TaxID=114742 RepID=A0AAD5LL33_PYTIN|nr:hypothetical protein P43SY_002908 [Pythium insidiosum]